MAFALHAFILCVVVIVPPWFYDMVRVSEWNSVRGLSYAGGLSYIVYAACLSTKIKSGRLRAVMFQLIALLTAAALVFVLTAEPAPLPVLLIPAVMGTFPLIGALGFSAMHKRSSAKTCLISAALLLPLGVLISAVLMLGSAMSAAAFRTGAVRLPFDVHAECRACLKSPISVAETRRSH